MVRGTRSLRTEDCAWEGEKNLEENQAERKESGTEKRACNKGVLASVPNVVALSRLTKVEEWASRIPGRGAFLAEGPARAKAQGQGHAGRVWGQLESPCTWNTRWQPLEGPWRWWQGEAQLADQGGRGRQGEDFGFYWVRMRSHWSKGHHLTCKGVLLGCHGDLGRAGVVAVGVEAGRLGSRWWEVFYDWGLGAVSTWSQKRALWLLISLESRDYSLGDEERLVDLGVVCGFAGTIRLEEGVCRHAQHPDRLRRARCQTCTGQLGLTGLGSPGHCKPASSITQWGLGFLLEVVAFAQPPPGGGWGAGAPKSFDFRMAVTTQGSSSPRETLQLSQVILSLIRRISAFLPK